MTDNTQPPLTAAELDKMESHPGCDDIRRRLIRELRAANARLDAIDATARGDAVAAIMEQVHNLGDVNAIRDAVAAQVARAERAEAERDAADRALVALADRCTQVVDHLAQLGKLEAHDILIDLERWESTIAAARERVARKEKENG
jgi:hypothetical protein